MSDHWNFYPSLVDGEPASIFVDIGIARSVPLTDFPVMAYLRVRMNKPRQDGLSSQEECEELISLEDSVSAIIKRDSTSVYVGRNTSAGNRDFYFYGRNSLIESALRSVMAKWPDYQFEIGSRADPEWSTYWRFLYPSAEDFQCMGNRDVIDALLENGDHIDRPRKIEHLAIFKTENDRNTFVEYVSDNGYNASQVACEIDGEFRVEFDKIDRPVEIDKVTIELYRAAKRHNGDYDGWGRIAAG